jgi:hypothetical protein
MLTTHAKITQALYSTPSDAKIFVFLSCCLFSIQSFFLVGAPQANDSLMGAINININVVTELPTTNTLFLLTWGYRDGDSQNPMISPDYKTMQSHLTFGYTNYQSLSSTETRSTYVAPAGLVFEDIYDNLATLYADTPNLFVQLYRDDGSHPSTLGTYLASLTIFCTITGRSPLRMGDVVISATVDADRVNVRRAIHRVLFENTIFNTDLFPYPYAYSQLSLYPPYAAAGAGNWIGVISGYVPLPRVRYDGGADGDINNDEIVSSLMLGDAQYEGGRL